MASGRSVTDVIHRKEIQSLKTKDTEILESITNLQKVLGNVDISSVGNSVTEILKRTNYRYTEDNLLSEMPSSNIAPGVYPVYSGSPTFPCSYGTVIIYGTATSSEFAALFLSSGIDNSVYYSTYNRHHGGDIQKWGPWKNLNSRPIGTTVSLINDWAGFFYPIKDGNYATLTIDVWNPRTSYDMDTTYIIANIEESVTPAYNKVSLAVMTDSSGHMLAQCSLVVSTEKLVYIRLAQPLSVTGGYAHIMFNIMYPLY